MSQRGSDFDPTEQVPSKQTVLERRIRSAVAHLDLIADADTVEDARRLAALALFALKGDF